METKATPKFNTRMNMPLHDRARRLWEGMRNGTITNKATIDAVKRDSRYVGLFAEFDKEAK